MGNKSMNTHRIVNDTDLPAPLPLRVVPYHDEDLLSVLRRSASAWAIQMSDGSCGRLRGIGS